MKSVFLRLGALCLACAPLIAPQPVEARAGGGGYDTVQEIRQFCQSLVENVPDTHWTVGTCVASFIAAGPSLYAFVCMSWEHEGVLDFFGFDTIGECVASGIAAP